jgi:hypothetical protein
VIAHHYAPIRAVLALIEALQWLSRISVETSPPEVITVSYSATNVPSGLVTIHLDSDWLLRRLPTIAGDAWLRRYRHTQSHGELTVDVGARVRLLAVVRDTRLEQLVADDGRLTTETRQALAAWLAVAA